MSQAILYLSYDGLTDPLGQSQILPYLCGLSEVGYRFTIISFEKPERFATGRVHIQHICDQYNMQWVPLTYHKSPPVLSTVYDVYRLWQEAKAWHRRGSFSLVHCRSYITALIGAALQRKYGMKFIFDMRGFWADERVEGGLWNASHVLYKRIYNFFKRQEKRLLQQADATVVLTEAARESILSWGYTDRITVIPCCVDLTLFNRDHIQAEEVTALRQQLGFAPDDYVLLYLGSLGTWYLQAEMEAFFRELRRQQPRARFLWLTPDQHLLTPTADYVIRTVKRHEVPLYITLSQASICFIKPSFSKRGSSATKMAEVMAMGVPVVTNAGWGDVDFMGRSLRLCRVVDLGQNMAAPVQALLHDSTLKTPDTAFYDWFSLKSGVARYAALYRDLLN